MLENNLWNWRATELGSPRILLGYMNTLVMTQASKTILDFLQNFLPNLFFWGFPFLYHGMLILFFGKANSITYSFFLSAMSIPSFEQFLVLTAYNEISDGSN